MPALADYRNHPAVRTAAFAGSATAAIVGLLALKYNDRAIFDEHREGIATKPGWPLVGQLPSLVANKEKIHEWFLEGFEDLDVLTT